MNCSMLLTNLSADTSVTAGAVIPVGSAVHGFGKAISLRGNSIILREAGYYGINASVSVSVTGGTATSVSLYADGVPITGAEVTATPADANATIDLTLPWILRKRCGCEETVLTFVISNAGTINNAIIEVSKI